MAKRDRTQEALDRLAADVDEEPRSAKAQAALRKALGDRSALVVAAALKVIGEHELTGFETEIRAAFDRAMVDPGKTDPGCRIKMGVVGALDALREPADELFLQGIRHVQHEPAWGGSQDSAAGLRGMCAQALVNRGYIDAMIELARLLADPEKNARRAAADAIAASGDARAGVPLLMLRILAKDPEPEVLGACFGGLLSLSAEQTFEFVVEHLRARDPLVAEAAALALGQERPEGALAALSEFADHSHRAELRRVAFLAIAMLRSEPAWSYLLEQVADESLGVARDAIEALAVYRELPGLAERVREAVGRRGRPRDLAELLAPFRERDRDR
jgi:HEAT repeat protein